MAHEARIRRLPRNPYFTHVFRFHAPCQKDTHFFDTVNFRKKNAREVGAQWNGEAVCVDSCRNGSASLALCERIIIIIYFIYHLIAPDLA